MEGTLEKFIGISGTLFSSEEWKTYYFILHEEILLFTQLGDRSRVEGRLHMSISNILPKQKDDSENEFRIHSGLIEIRLKANNIQQKSEWVNLLNQARQYSQSLKMRMPISPSQVFSKNQSGPEIGPRNSSVNLSSNKQFGSHQLSAKTSVMKKNKFYDGNNMNDSVDNQSGVGSQMNNSNSRSHFDKNPLTMYDNGLLFSDQRNQINYKTTRQTFPWGGNSTVSTSSINRYGMAADTQVNGQQYWSEFLNLQFNTQIFGQNCAYIFELGNIYLAVSEIDACLNEIIPSIKVYKRLASSVQNFQESIDMLKSSTKRCVGEMEQQRRNMYSVAKRMLQLREQLQAQSISVSRDSLSERYNQLRLQSNALTRPQDGGNPFVSNKPPSTQIESPATNHFNNNLKGSGAIKTKKIQGEQNEEDIQFSPSPKQKNRKDQISVQQSDIKSESTFSAGKRNGSTMSFQSCRQTENLEDDQSEFLDFEKLQDDYEKPSLLVQDNIKNFKEEIKQQAVEVSKLNYKNFKGTRAFTSLNKECLSRNQLPFLRPENETIPIWSIIGKFVGQDLTKISMPVIISEPLTLLQRGAESLNMEEYLVQKAAKTPDQYKRLAMVIAHNLCQFIATKYRCKKPFNSMLGETYELVTEDFRFFAEQVSHHPPISAFVQEGKGYRISSFLDSKSKFGFGGGKGLLVMNQIGYIDYYFDEYDEEISIGRPNVHACNLILGSLYIDLDGIVKAFNHKTGDTAEIKFDLRGWTTSSVCSGTINDKLGNVKYRIEGTWLEKLYLVDEETGQKEILWEEPATFENYKKQFGFGHVTINLNYIDDEMKQFIAPTDCRLRGDMRLYEQGKVDEADEEKIRLEVKQRKTRKERHDAGIEWEPKFFKEVPHPHIEGEKRYEVVKERNYWQRRENRDWGDMDDLW